jgi:hypothetical protein
MVFVGLAVANMQLVKRHVLAAPGADDGVLPASARLLAVASLLLWIAATTAGRLMAYLGPVGGL